MIAAGLAQSRIDGEPDETRFRGLDAVPAEVGIRTFECRSCENLCEVQQMTAGEGRRSFFGSVCGRFERGEEAPIAADDAFAVRERLLLGADLGACGRPDGVDPARRLGVPFALSLADHLPFWRTFLGDLGFDIELSGQTDREKVAVGLARVPEEFCQPVKVLFGHVHDLLDRGCKRLFVPHLRMFRPPAPDRSGTSPLGLLRWWLIGATMGPLE